MSRIWVRVGVRVWDWLKVRVRVEVMGRVTLRLRFEIGFKFENTLSLRKGSVVIRLCR
jgi:hypothetical protein